MNVDGESRYQQSEGTIDQSGAQQGSPVGLQNISMPDLSLKWIACDVWLMESGHSAFSLSAPPSAVFFFSADTVRPAGVKMAAALNCLRRCGAGASALGANWPAATQSLSA